MRTRQTIGLLVLSLCLLGADTEDANKKDQKAMQGDWAGDRFVRDGMAFPDDDAQGFFRTNKDDTYTVFRFRKKISSGKFKLDASKSPKQINMIPDGAPEGVSIKGIYKIEGNKLTICYALPKQDRPTAFESKEKTGHTLTVWIREKK
jgi:uncharacterized protein (TIGR03067 family)